MVSQRIFYTYTAYEYYNAQNECSESFEEKNINLLLNQTVDLNISLLMALSRRSHPFVLTLSDESISDVKDKTLNFIYTLSTLDIYCTIRGSKILLYDAIPENEAIAALDKVEHFFKAQGDKLLLLPIPNANDKSFGPVLRLTMEELSSEAMYKNLTNELLSKDYAPLILLPSNANESERIRNPFFDQMQLLLNLKVTLDEYLQENELLHERAQLYLSFIPISKMVNTKNYLELQRWYEKEYEILPLWFKRLGHIIKMLMGKRSIKSLIKN